MSGIIPAPVELEYVSDSPAFELKTETTLAGPTAAVAYVRETIGKATGLGLGEGGESADIVLKIDDELGAEAYALEVSATQIQLSGGDAAGLFYGTQSVRQLLAPSVFADGAQGGTYTVPAVRVVDRPRFGWRGMHLDSCRHFLPLDFIYKFIDLLALHKFNVLHWHLTEDQGWRVEIAKYPRLTEVGSTRTETLIGHDTDRPRQYDGTPHGGYYTQAELRAVVDYATKRHITIVPEIDMPGHMQAAVAAYPELGCAEQPVAVRTHWGISSHILNADESTILFMQDVLGEVMDIFPSTFIHVGGDEAHKDEWKASASVQARIRELGLADEAALQSYFIGRMDQYLSAAGRRLIGWDEILEGGLAAGATVMSWRGEEGGVAAAKAGHDVVMAPNSHTYFDHYQADKAGEPLAIGGFTTTRKVYEYEPIPAALNADEARHVLGSQGQLWSEYLPTPAQVEYMAFPRACALAEVLWSPTDRREWDDFVSRLEEHVVRLDALSVNRYRGDLAPEPVE